MISWPIVAGAFGGGLLVTLWLEIWLRRQRRPSTPATSRLKTFTLACMLLAVSGLILGLYLVLGPDRAPAHAVQVRRAGTAVSSPGRPASQLLPTPNMSVLDETTGATPANGVSPSEPENSVTAAVTGHLRIPSLDLDSPIEIIPIRAGQWDVSQLGGRVGWLTTTGTHPGDDTAMVFVGHMTYPTLSTLERGAFAYLQTVTFGTRVIYDAGDTEYTYVVREIGRVPPGDVDRLYLPDGDSLLLVTCTDWDNADGIYSNRLLVRAIRTDFGPAN